MTHENLTQEENPKLNPAPIPEDFQILLREVPLAQEVLRRIIAERHNRELVALLEESRNGTTVATKDE